MGEYTKCPQCENIRRGDRIMQRDKCGAIFCASCCRKHGLLRDVAACPKCDKSDFTRLGRIV